MELTSEQRKDLRAALISAFPGQPQLELMIEDELEESFNQITQGQPDYELTVRDLVKWAEAGGKLYGLIMGASVKKPGNPLLQRFIQEHLETLLVTSAASSFISLDIFISLVNYPNLVVDFAGDILSAVTQTLPDLEIDDTYADVKSYLRNDQLNSIAKWLVVLRLFLRYGKNSKGQFYLVIFVQNLKQRLVDDTSKAVLETWLANLPAEIQPTPSTLIDPPVSPSDKVLKNLRAYFVITIEPPEITAQTNQFRVKGYLITRSSKNDELIQFKTITLSPPVADGSDESTEARQQRQGLFCTFQQIEDSLPDWLLQTEQAIDHQCAELQRDFKLEFPPVYNLTVEFWLPFGHLTAAADAWKIYSQPVRLKRRNSVVGREYPVVVRSYDRFSDSRAMNALNRLWQHWDDFWQQPSNPGALRQKIPHVDCWEHWMTIRQQAEPSLLGLTLTCPLCTDQYQQQREDLFAWILEEGIPMALWSRCLDAAEHQQGMDELLTTDTLAQLDRLLEQIKQTRRLAINDQHLGQHLAIWCDEPKRLIELKQFLKQGKLSA